VLWVWVLNPQYGLVNTILQSVGLPAPGWLADPDWAKPALILMSAWGAGHNMVLYLAGLQEVPRELHEAAAIDGASVWQRTRYITLPLITPVLFFTLIMGMIGSFQYFTSAWVMSGNGPDDSTLFYALYLFNNAFLYFRMGYASAMAWLLFLVILGATLLIFRFSEGRVHYETGN
jgi:multiple sugar transport system permease protein